MEMTLIIKDCHVFCCGKYLGELDLDKVYVCPKCLTLSFYERPEQREILEWI